MARAHGADQRRVAEPAEDLAERLALVERERRDVDQSDRVRGAGPGDGDHRTAVGVADQQDRPVDLVDVAGDVLRVVGQAAQRIRRRENRHIVGLQLLDDRRPERGVGKAAVNENDRGGVRVVRHGLSLREMTGWVGGIEAMAHRRAARLWHD